MLGIEFPVEAIKKFDHRIIEAKIFRSDFKCFLAEGWNTTG